MAKTSVTKELERAISVATSKIGTFGCCEVTIGPYGDERVDYMTVDAKGIWRCFEIKCSVSDFHSKAKKTFVGHYNYFVLTDELYEKVKDEIPKHIGVYVGSKYVRCIKKARKRSLKVENEVLTMSMIRSLARDANKLYISGNDEAINKYKRTINQQTEEIRRLKKDLYYANLELTFARRHG